MLEILLIIFLCRSMGTLAAQKGQPTGRWKAYTALGWILGEIGGIMISMMFVENLLVNILIGYAVAGTIYFILRQSLKSKPDVEPVQDWINQIGVQEETSNH